MNSAGHSGAGAPVSAAADGGNPADLMQPITRHHALYAEEKLEAAGLPFFKPLQDGYAKYFPDMTVPETVSDMVQRFTRCPAERVEDLFFAVRHTLDALSPSGSDTTPRGQAEEAAAALYCMAACRLVNEAAHSACIAAPGTSKYVMKVPSSERLICAVIATALFGGKLRLIPAADPEWPQPEYVFEVKPSAAGDFEAQDFERAAYVAVFPNDRASTGINLDTGRLSPQLSAKLARRLKDIRKVQERSFALVIHGSVQPESCQDFALKNQTPVLFPATEATAALLNMDAYDLLAEIQEFWRRLKVLSHPTTSTHPQPPNGNAAMSSSGPTFNAPVGSVILTTGNHSPVASGTDSTASVVHQEGVDFAAIAPLLQELAQKISELPSGKARDALGTQVKTIEAEVVKQAAANPGVIERALKAIKPGVELGEAGVKIATLCNTIYKTLAPIFGLPPSPSP